MKRQRRASEAKTAPATVGRAAIARARRALGAAPADPVADPVAGDAPPAMMTPPTTTPAPAVRLLPAPSARPISAADDFAQYLAAIQQRMIASGDPWAAAAAEALTTAVEELRATEDALLAARELAEQERQRYQDLFQFAPDAYLVTDVHGKILESNLAAAAMLNVRHDYLLSKPMVVFVDRRDRGLMHDVISSLRERRRDTQPGHWTLHLVPRGREQPIVVQVTAVAVRETGTGVMRGVRWAMRDVTEQHRRQVAIAEQERRLAAMTAELARAEEGERQRIATGIHDRISQPLAAIKMALGEVRRSMSASAMKRAEGALNELASMLEHAIAESRTLTFELSPPILYQLGLVPAIQWLAEQVSRRHGLSIEVVDHCPPAVHEALPLEYRVLLFQSVRELLNNVVKHAGATQATVTVTEATRSRTTGGGRVNGRRHRSGDGDDDGDGVASEAAGESDASADDVLAVPRRGANDSGAGTSGKPSIRIEIRDNGQGFRVDEVLRPGGGSGFGLFNVRTRLEQIGGRLEVRSSRGGRDHGTRAILTVQLGAVGASHTPPPRSGFSLMARATGTGTGAAMTALPTATPDTEATATAPPRPPMGPGPSQTCYHPK